MSKTLFSFPSLAAITPAVALGLSLTSGSAIAANAVTLNEFANGYVLNQGSVLQTTIGTGSSSWGSNPSLSNSAWAHAGKWFEFELAEAATVTISAGADVSGTVDPAISVYTSGGTAFDGGTGGVGDGFSTASFPAPHSFNAASQLGAQGTKWMQEGGNMQETLGYANAGSTFATESTGWGETILEGESLGSGTYESGVSWTTGDNYADLVLNDLAPGFYSIFLGGANHSLAGGDVNLSVSAVPLPAAVWLFASGFIGLVGMTRRKNKA
ncbi:MAG: VPLPA-CTERM sorting domain-containing protein [Gammaproteobacteria bacterium]|nr:VPLPA-CTERM sorting domain-containing protein [Gammaproteobacteria bacterium]